MNLIKRVGLAGALSTMLGVGSVAGGQEFVVDQKDKNFIYKGTKVVTLSVKVGDVIQFRNMDPYYHNVFSLSDVQMFDLGSYPQGQSKSVKFSKVGKVEIECAIHPQMRMVVEVKQ